MNVGELKKELDRFPDHFVVVAAEDNPETHHHYIEINTVQVDDGEPVILFIEDFGLWIDKRSNMRCSKCNVSF